MAYSSIILLKACRHSLIPNLNIPTGLGDVQWNPQLHPKKRPEPPHIGHHWRRQRFETRAQAESTIREHIEIFYNRQRRHSRIGYLAPAVFAQSFTRLAA
ncbi:MAG: IS3 family transposase [Acidithiobacillus ferriphilus]|nr:IS3 family transposase [Acidithiobacillus ferriphilus]MBW9254922.1 IS3 family transposase [Acidithiobacillus ferriphilus]